MSNHVKTIFAIGIMDPLSSLDAIQLLQAESLISAINKNMEDGPFFEIREDIDSGFHYVVIVDSLQKEAA